MKKNLNLKCLSVQQPFADLICAGVKTVENRTWETNHRGTVLIHASKTVSAQRALGMAEKFKEMNIFSPEFTLPDGNIDVEKFSNDIHYREVGWYLKCVNNMDSDREPMQTGAIIGIADLKRISVDEDRKGNEWAIPCQHHWVFENARFFRNPIVKVKGKLRLYNQEIEEGLVTIDMLEHLFNEDGLSKSLDKKIND